VSVMAIRLKKVTQELWQKTYQTPYEICISTLSIAPQGSEFLLVSSLLADGKRDKDDVFRETTEQVEERRRCLLRDGYTVTTRQVRAQ